jgi:hypothetical protein
MRRASMEASSWPSTSTARNQDYHKIIGIKMVKNVEIPAIFAQFFKEMPDGPMGCF